MRRFVLPFFTLLVVAAIWWSNRQRQIAFREPVLPATPPAAARGSGAARSTPDTGASSSALPPEPPQLRAAPAFNPNDFPLAAALNAPGSNIQADLDALRQILEAWRTNFPRTGNPVGENNEIAAALSGANPLEIVLIPKTHRAFNARGELCDRWGTPFRFHQLSGQKMELTSAGPDRKFGTADDAMWSPP